MFDADVRRYAFLTRLMQSEAVGLSYELWRRAWQGPKKEYVSRLSWMVGIFDGSQCAGVLVWQLNDCWPVTSWAIVDYFVGSISVPHWTQLKVACI